MDSILVLCLVIGLYFLPTIVGYSRNVPSLGSVAVINVFLGWTLIGWVVALAMAARTVPEAHLQALEAQRQAQWEQKQQRQLAKLEAGRPSWWR